jgi:hypothetical protein
MNLKAHPHDYLAQHQGEQIKRYRIMRPGAKHIRRERDQATNQFVPVIYGCPTPSDDLTLRIRNHILLTAKDAEKLKHMQLVEAPLQEAPLEIKTEAAVAVDPAAAVVDVKTETGVTIPADWRSQPPAFKKRLATQLVGSPVRRAAEAEKIIEEMAGGTQHPVSS